MSINNLTEEEFEQRIIDDWAEYFESSPEEFEERGSKYLKRENYAENRVIVAHVGRRTFVQYSPNSEGRILAFAELCPNNFAVTADHLVSYFKNENIRIECLDNLFYLYPVSLRLFTPGERFVVRKLLVDDEAYLDELNNSCSKEEVDNSFVEIDELGVWGCFINDRLVAAASFSDWGLYGDFGVITHPELRKQGLAKAVVSAACKEAIGIGKIPVYRCHITLFSSISTAKSVGFSKYPRTYFKMEVLEFTR
ncbi:MAG: GNAT family N-acetyltransferase [Anaerolineales bacterium]|nr:GNAT family N-acetyltransferase [Anaerolineales bacterium]